MRNQACRLSTDLKGFKGMFMGYSDRFWKTIPELILLGFLGILLSASGMAAQPPLGVSVAWKPNTEPDLAGYHIYYGPQSRVYTNRVTVGVNATTVRLEPLMAGGTYYLAMTAFNTANVESLPTRDLVYRVPTNQAPTITAIDDQVTAEDMPSGSIGFTVSDAESPASALTVTARSSNRLLIPDEYVLLGGGDSARNLIIVPQLDQSGSADITVTVHDPQGASNSVTFTVYVVPVNDDPVVIFPVSTISLDEDGASGNFRFYVFDAESAPTDLWTVAFSSNPLLVPDETITMSSGKNSRTMSFAPARDAFGSCTIDVFVLDDDGAYGWTQFPVLVRPVNDPPTISPIQELVLNEDTPSATVVKIRDVDDAPTDLTLSASSSNPLLVGAENIALGGTQEQRTMVISPKANQFGSCVISLVVTDPKGASSTNNLTVTVNPVNDAPKLDPIPSFSVDEGAGPLTVPLSGINSGAPNELQPLVVTAASSNPNLVPPPQIDYVSPNDVGSLTIAPVPDTNGTAVITVSVSDGDSANGVTTQSFTVSVRTFNNPPTIYSLQDLGILRAPTPLHVSFNVQDPDSPLSGLLISGYSSDPTLLPPGNLVFSGTGIQRTLTVYPVAGRTGLATVTIVVSDGTATVSASFWVLITSGGA